LVVGASKGQSKGVQPVLVPTEEVLATLQNYCGCALPPELLNPGFIGEFLLGPNPQSSSISTGPRFSSNASF
jgi:hypothetical protein